MSWIQANWDEVINLLTMIVALASAFAAMTPSPRDNQIAVYLRKIVDFMAFNWGNAKNDKSKTNSRYGI